MERKFLVRRDGFLGGERDSGSEVLDAGHGYYCRVAVVAPWAPVQLT